MPLAVVGVSHRSAPIEVRERFAMRRSEIPPTLGGLVETGAVREAVLLSTCNRTELYLHVPDGHRGIEAARAALTEHAGESAGDADRLLYVRRDRHAAEHLFRVAAGLDSMILGEPQVQGQVKEAYELARETTSSSGPVVGPLLHRVFQSALAVGGRVRTETEIGIGAASVPSAAVELARKIFGSLHGRRALVLGAGEMSELTLECLHADGVRSAVVANRDFDRACELAEQWGGRAIRLEEFAGAIREVDIVVCSTAAPHPVLTRARFQEALPNGAPHPLCIIDIAIPRDVESSVGDEPNVFLYNIDDLHHIVDANLDRRRTILPGAESIIVNAGEEFWTWYSSLSVVPTIRDLRARGEDVRQAETERLLRRLSHLTPEDREAIDALTRSLMNKLLHAPTVRLREAAGNGRGTAVLDAVRYLFALDEGAAERQEMPHGASEEGGIAEPE